MAITPDPAKDGFTEIRRKEAQEAITSEIRRNSPGEGRYLASRHDVVRPVSPGAFLCGAAGRYRRSTSSFNSAKRAMTASAPSSSPSRRNPA